MIRLRSGALVLVGSLLLGVPACGDDSGSAPTTTAAAACIPGEPVLRVDLIDDAVAAVEAERGGPQRYYEINATSRLVNLFVAGETQGEVVPYAYVDGDLSSQSASPGAQGSTFPAASLDFDPRRVTACAAVELPSATFEAFEVLGGADDVVRYSIIARSQAGGQLIIGVAPDGAVLSADPV